MLEATIVEDLQLLSQIHQGICTLGFCEKRFPGTSAQIFLAPASSDIGDEKLRSGIDNSKWEWAGHWGLLVE
jgi:hypothetical protein